MFIFSFMIVMCVLYLKCGDDPDEVRLRNFNKFNESLLQGKLSDIGSSSGMTYIALKGDSVVFEFLPYIINGESNVWFNEIASRNDSIYKAPYKDTLFLFKPQKTYLFSFRRWR